MMAQARILHTGQRVDQPRQSVVTAGGLNQSGLLNNINTDQMRKHQSASQRQLLNKHESMSSQHATNYFSRNQPTGEASNQNEDLNMKLIQANNLEASRCAQNNKMKYRSSKIQGVLRRVGVSASNSTGNRLTADPQDHELDKLKDTTQNPIYCNAKAATLRDPQNDLRRKPSPGQQLLPNDMTFYFGGTTHSSNKPELVTF